MAEYKKVIPFIRKAVEKNDKFNDPFDKCVICGADTPYRRSTPINERAYYVEGSGQICRKCNREINS